MSTVSGLNKFKKLEKIGEGSFGEVYKAEDEETKEIYAVKIFRNEFNLNSSDYLSTLFREVEVFSKLNHPAILPFIAFSYFSFDDEQRPAIVTKFATNGSLDQIIQFKKQYPLVPFWDNTKILCNIYGIASAIAYLHAHNIVHLDLKPANILLDDYLFPLVCDFGLAKILDTNHQNLTTSASSGIRGTATHIAPEIWKKGKYTTSCDTYSFSLVVYSIFTNEEPFANYNQYQFFVNVISSGERPELSSKIPDPFKKLIQKCWSENSEERPTFDHIVKELAENPEYIIEGVDKDKYRKYVDLINHYQTTFDTFSEKPPKQDDIMKGHFEKVNISDELNKVSEIDPAFENLFKTTIDELNQNLSPHKQETIKKIIFKDSQKVNFLDLHINSEEVNQLYKDETLNSPHLIGILKFFRNISMDIQFPSKDFESIMKMLTYIKKKVFKRIYLNGIVSNVNAIGHEFKNNTVINNIIVKPPVSFISKEAFRGCIFLKSITLPPGLTTIEDSTFSMCEKIEDVNFPPNLKSIGVNAFRGDHMLKNIRIPSSVTEIGKSCFRGDNRLENIVLPDSLISLNKSVLKGCVLLREVVIPPHVKVIDSGAFEQCLILCKIVIPHSVEVVKDNAFKCCVALNHVSFDPLKTRIEKDAFYDCANLRIIVITTKENSFSLDMQPFPLVKEIIIPKNVTSIQNPLPGIKISVSPLNIGDNGINDIPFTDESIGRLGIDSFNNT